MKFFNSLDRKYFDYAYRSLKSFYKYNDYEFYIFSVDLTQNEIIKLRSISKKINILYNIKYNKKNYNKLYKSKLFKIDYIRTHVCSLFFNLEKLKKLFPNEYIVKCDLDTVFYGSIPEFNILNNQVGMCIDERLYWYKQNTCNGGFVVFNPKYNFLELFEKYLETYDPEQDLYLEQDFLNTLSIYNIDNKYNYTKYRVFKPNIVMLHYSGEKSNVEQFLVNFTRDNNEI